jgi:hypothetical protein
MDLRVTLQLPLQNTQKPARSLDGTNVLLIGHGYVAKALGPKLRARGCTVQHTSRETGPIVFGSETMRVMFGKADFVLISVPPDRNGGDPTLKTLLNIRSHARWIGYLSATSVYGDRDGDWAFEGEAPTPTLARGRRRADAELAWLETYPQTHIFRLAGIYGPGRDPFSRLRKGEARIVDAPGHVVNRIHVDDIVSALIASMQRPNPQDIYNLADGNPATPGDVLNFAADLIKVDRPPTVSLNDPSVSEMARSFYAETKRIDISRARARLGWAPQFATYQAGLRAILDAMEASTSASP